MAYGDKRLTDDSGICVIDIGYEFSKKRIVRKVCRAWLIYHSGWWDTVKHKREPGIEEYEWDIGYYDSLLHLKKFPDMIEKCRHDKHGITKEDIGGFKLEDYYCAIRRALRDIPLMTIIEDVDIQDCIEWGILPEALPTRWEDKLSKQLKT